MDHLARGCGEYICAASSVDLIRTRLGSRTRVYGVEFGTRFRFEDVEISFHPASHILGSAQVRIEAGGEVWVVSGDYKRQADPSCEPFEVVPCDTFVTEATFACEKYVWKDGRETIREIRDWWDTNRALGKTCVLFAYALGKTQRILAGLAELARESGDESLAQRSVFVHADLEPLNECYRRAGVSMLPTETVPRKLRGKTLPGELILAPPKYIQSSWYDRFGDCETAFASGWMANEDIAIARGFTRGFALSDHADWGEILQTIEECGAKRVLAYHGEAGELLDHLTGLGIEAGLLREI